MERGFLGSRVTSAQGHERPSSGHLARIRSWFGRGRMRPDAKRMRSGQVRTSLSSEDCFHSSRLLAATRTTTSGALNTTNSRLLNSK